MAKIQENLFLLKVSKLSKNSDSDVELLDAATRSKLEDLMQEFVDNKFVIEIETLDDVEQ